MTAISPRHPWHRGSVLASGLAIDTRLVPEPIARDRLLALASDGSDVFRSGPFLIARLRDPLRLDCSAALGIPLVRNGRLLAACPLDPDEQKRLDAPVDTAVLVAGGSTLSVGLDAQTRVDLASWIDVSEFRIIPDVHSLGAILLEPRSAAIEFVSDVRETFGVGPAADEREHVIRSLRQRGAATDGRPPRAAASAATGSVLSSLWRLFRRARPTPRRAGSAARGAAPDREQSTALAPRESWFAKLRTAIRRLAARTGLLSRLAPLVGRRHAEYLARMLEMFDNNQLDEALRHAIPLSSDLEGALRPPSLKTPSPRADLAISPARAAASTSLGLHGDLFEELRARYRRAFDRLVARGDIDKAAFVLAELLHADAEAISFLERHARFRLAAELAEARRLPPGLIVRQWFLAGDRARAIRIARQTGAFADAVVRLESSHKEEAQALRLIWADALASSGAYAAAVDAVWPVAQARTLALHWLDRAIAIGGATEARMLVRKARLAPESFAPLRDRAFELLRGDGEDREWIIATLGHALVADAPTAETMILARATARRLLRAPQTKAVDRLVQRLLDACGDPVFRADVRAATSPVQQARASIRMCAAACTQARAKDAFNEDLGIVTFLASPPSSSLSLDGDASAHGVALGVFDGAGGVMPESDHPSRRAAKTVIDVLRSEFAGAALDSAHWARALADSLERANAELWQGAEPAWDWGSAATVATLCRDQLLIAHVGQSRCYLSRGTAIAQLTRDHTLLNKFIDERATQGAPMARHEIDELAFKRVITRSLGITADVDIDLLEVALQDGDVILLCSDGLWSVVEEAAIQRVLVEHPVPGVACDTLLAMAQAANAPDDITIVVARISGPGLPRRQPGPPVTQRAIAHALDASAIRSIIPLGSRSTPIDVRRTAADRGTMAIADAAQLPDGRFLIALGEIGLWLWSREGRVLTRFSEPATHIVLSDHGDRALLLARRGETFRVSRLDLVTMKLRPWCDARFDQFAPDFDGATWFVARGDTTYAIDATADRWEHFWKVDERAAIVRAIRRDARTTSIWLAMPDGDELWTYELPSLALRRRQVLGTALPIGSIAPIGFFAGWRAHPEGALTPHLLKSAWHDLPVATTELPDAPWLDNDWLVLPVAYRAHTTLHVMDTAKLEVRARIDLEGPRHPVGVRFQGEHLLIFDSHGRLLVLSLRSGAVLRDDRIS